MRAMRTAARGLAGLVAVLAVLALNGGWQVEAQKAPTQAKPAVSGSPEAVLQWLLSMNDLVSVIVGMSTTDRDALGREAEALRQKSDAAAEAYARKLKGLPRAPGTGERFLVVLHHRGIGGTVFALSSEQPEICPGVVVGHDNLIGIVERRSRPVLYPDSVEYFGILARDTKEGLCYTKQTSTGDDYCAAFLDGSGHAAVTIVLPGVDGPDEMQVIIRPLVKAPPPKVKARPATPDEEDLADLPLPKPLVPSYEDVVDDSLRDATATSSSKCPDVSDVDTVNEYLRGDRLQFELPDERKVRGLPLHAGLVHSHTYTQGLDEKPWAEGHHYTMLAVRTGSSWTIEQKKLP